MTSILIDMKEINCSGRVIQLEGEDSDSNVPT